MKKSVKIIAFWITLLTGLGLVFIGIRFFVIPELATTAFGISMPSPDDFSFQHIKGIRDAILGLMVTALLLFKEYRALGIILLVSTFIPVTDFSIVLAHNGRMTASVYPHLTAVLICILTGIYYVRFPKPVKQLQTSLSQVNI